MRTFSPRRDDFLGHLIQGIYPPTIEAEGHAALQTGRFPNVTYASLHRDELINQATYGAPGLHGFIDNVGGLALRVVGAGLGWFAASFSKHGERAGTQVIGAGVGYLLGAGLSKLTGGE